MYRSSSRNKDHLAKGGEIFFFWENIVCCYRIPNALIMNNDPQLKGEYMQEFYDGLHICMAPSSVAHPRTNDQKEAINGVILAKMKKRLEEAKRGWLNELTGILGSIRTILTQEPRIPFSFWRSNMRLSFRMRLALRPLRCSNTSRKLMIRP